MSLGAAAPLGTIIGLRVAELAPPPYARGVLIFG